jgi:hypothetical protein
MRWNGTENVATSRYGARGAVVTCQQSSDCYLVSFSFAILDSILF